MAQKKKRKQRITVYGIAEGEREKKFLIFLIEVYKPRDNNISPTLSPSNGGTPNKMIGEAFKECQRDRCFIWFDEDFESVSPISDEYKKS